MKRNTILLVLGSLLLVACGEKSDSRQSVAAVCDNGFFKAHDTTRVALDDAEKIRRRIQTTGSPADIKRGRKAIAKANTACVSLYRQYGSMSCSHRSAGGRNETLSASDLKNHCARIAEDYRILMSSRGPVTASDFGPVVE